MGPRTSALILEWLEDKLLARQEQGENLRLTDGMFLLTVRADFSGA